MYETSQKEHKQEFTEAVDEATELKSLPPNYYKVALAVLLVITVLWLGEI